jgi:predicted GNAT family acetyltransferase
MSDVEVTNNPDQGRYEAWLDGELAGFAAYQSISTATVFTHTEVDDKFGGRGVGGELARGALDDVRAHGLGVVPLCPFIKGWIEKHSDYQDLVVSH